MFRIKTDIRQYKCDSYQKVEKLIRNWVIRPNDLIYHEEDRSWMPIGEFKEFQTIFAELAEKGGEEPGDVNDIETSSEQESSSGPDKQADETPEDSSPEADAPDNEVSNPNDSDDASEEVASAKADKQSSDTEQQEESQNAKPVDPDSVTTTQLVLEDLQETIGSDSASGAKNKVQEDAEESSGPVEPDDEETDSTLGWPSERASIEEEVTNVRAIPDPKDDSDDDGETETDGIDTASRDEKDLLTTIDEDSELETVSLDHQRDHLSDKEDESSVRQTDEISRPEDVEAIEDEDEDEPSARQTDEISAPDMSSADEESTPAPDQTNDEPGTKETNDGEAEKAPRLAVGRHGLPEEFFATNEISTSIVRDLHAPIIDDLGLMRDGVGDPDASLEKLGIERSTDDAWDNMLEELSSGDEADPDEVPTEDIGLEASDEADRTEDHDKPEPASSHSSAKEPPVNGYTIPLPFQIGPSSKDAEYGILQTTVSEEHKDRAFPRPAPKIPGEITSRVFSLSPAAALTPAGGSPAIKSAPSPSEVAPKTQGHQGASDSSAMFTKLFVFILVAAIIYAIYVWLR